MVLPKRLAPKRCNLAALKCKRKPYVNCTKALELAWCGRVNQAHTQKTNKKFNFLKVLWKTRTCAQLISDGQLAQRARVEELHKLQTHIRANKARNKQRK